MLSKRRDELEHSM